MPTIRQTLQLCRPGGCLHGESAVVKRHESARVVYMESSGRHHAELWLVMDYIPTNLRALIYDHNRRPTIGPIKYYVKELASGLAYLHRKEIHHGDLKPDNVLVGQNHQIKIADFDVSEDLTNPSSRRVFCSLSYRAPKILFRTDRQTLHPTKRFGWSRQFELLGFQWDLDRHSVELTPHKRDKYLAKIHHLLRQTPPEQVSFTYDYKDISSVIGSLVHICVIFSERRSNLNALYAHRNRFHPERRGHRLHLPRDVLIELKDWARFLRMSDLSASFSLPATNSSLEIYSDASNAGCGIVVGRRAQFWALPEHARTVGVDIGVMEMWALHLALQAVIQLGVRDSVVTFHVDNLGVVFAARKGRSRSKLTNSCLNDAAMRAMGANIIMSIVYVASADNIADAPSRGDATAFAPLLLHLAEPWEYVTARPAASK